MQEQRVDMALAEWLRALRFRRSAERALRRKGLTFAQWRVLRAASQLVRESEDAVSQHTIRARLQMDANTISGIVRRLTEKGLIDWGLDDRDWSYRILVTTKGAAALTEALRAVLRAADVCVFGKPRRGTPGD